MSSGEKPANSFPGVDTGMQKLEQPPLEAMQLVRQSILETNDRMRGGTHGFPPD